MALWRSLRLATLAAVLLGLADRAPAGIVVGTSFRETFSRAAGVGFFVDDGMSTTAGGTFFDAASSVDDQSTGPFITGIYTATATQNSSVTSLALSGSGTAGGSALQLNPFSPQGVVQSDSVLDVTFSVDAPGAYLLAATVSYSETPPFGHSGATLALTRLTTPALLAFFQRTDLVPGSSTNSLSLTLTPGNLYRLRADANVGGNGGADFFNGISYVPPQFSEATASWSFSLTPVAVPEASAWLAVGLAGCLAGAARQWRTIRRSRTV